jgi:hypothetical protein
MTLASLVASLDVDAAANTSSLSQHEEEDDMLAFLKERTGHALTPVSPSSSLWEELKEARAKKELFAARNTSSVYGRHCKLREILNGGH